MQITVNGTAYQVASEWRQDKLLWVLREACGLTGTKYGCGAGQCGARTVLIDGQPSRACLLDAAACTQARIETVEGLGTADAPSPLQQAWLELRVAQCGYCQAGQLMSATALLRQTPRPDQQAIDAAMAGNLCRCGTYARVRQAIHLAASRP